MPHHKATAKKFAAVKREPWELQSCRDDIALVTLETLLKLVESRPEVALKESSRNPIMKICWAKIDVLFGIFGECYELLKDA